MRGPTIAALVLALTGCKSPCRYFETSRSKRDEKFKECLAAVRGSPNALGYGEAGELVEECWSIAGDQAEVFVVSKTEMCWTDSVEWRDVP